MESKIMQVFYGNDCLPYKDRERQVHYPIVGNAFLGASNTTKIRFYFDYIGDSNTTWVSVAKLPNGKQGSRVLPIASDDDGNYAELELSNWYTQAKGDVYIALQGYQGGVQYEYDSETELYEIHGTPTIQTTGSIKLAINYAPIGDSADYNDEFSTYQDILALLGDKADVDNVYSKTEVDSALNGKVDKRNTTGQFLYGHRVSQEIEVPYSNFVFANYLVQRDDNGEINVPTTPSDNSKATSKSYVDSELSSGLATKQNTLVSGTNIKTINQQSLLGSGNIDIQAGGGAWGEITGDIQDQTDLQNELQDIREVAEGKCKTLVITYNRQAPTSVSVYKKVDGTSFTDLADFNSYVGERTIGNPSFNSQSNTLSLSNYYIIGEDLIVYRDSDLPSIFSVGDIILIVETDVPDRWVQYLFSNLGFYNKLETTKVDLTGYATKTELGESIENLAQPYDSTTSYAIGDKVIYNGKLYTCTTAISTPETWDSTHWSQISVASGFVDLDKAQTISGVKTFTEIDIADTTTRLLKDGNNKGEIGQTNNNFKFYDNNIRVNTPTFRPQTNNTTDLGASGITFKDLYLGNRAYFGTSGAYIGATGQTFGLYGYSTIRTSGTFSPVSDNTDDIGTRTRTYKDLYLSGQVIGASNVLNVINASDISNNTLTADQMAIMTNGKPTIIKGELLGFNDAIFYVPQFKTDRYYGIVIGARYTNYPSISMYHIVESTGVISVPNANSTRSINLDNVGGINGKAIPAYPSNTGTFVLKCVDGVLTWVAE